jgi:integrase
MTKPFRRTGGNYSLYVPTASHGLVQRGTGTADKAIATHMATLVTRLKNKREFALLDAVGRQALTLGDLYDADVLNQLEQLKLELTSGVVDDFLDEWLRVEASNGLTPDSVTLYRQRMRKLLAPITYTYELTPATVASLLANIKATPGTKRQYLYELASLCDFLVGRGKLESNPTHNKSVVKRPRKNRPRRRWERADVDQRIVEAAEAPYQAAFALAHGTGADRETLLHIQVRHLDFAKMEADLHGSKTDARRRSGVPIEPWAVPYLEAWCSNLKPNDLLFPGVSPDSLTDAHARARKRAGVEDYWLRDARHSWAIRAILSGRSLWQVSRWLGHSNIGMTASTYVHYDKEVEKLLGKSW